MYGNYDAKGKIPTVDLYLGVNKWDTVAVPDTSSTLTKEIMLISPSEDIYICLVNTGNGTPIISVLELRPREFCNPGCRIRGTISSFV